MARREELDAMKKEEGRKEGKKEGKQYEMNAKERKEKKEGKQRVESQGK